MSSAAVVIGALRVKHYGSHRSGFGRVPAEVFRPFFSPGVPVSDRYTCIYVSEIFLKEL